MNRFDLSQCTVCPRRCKANRYLERGACGAGADMCVAKVMMHHWEEPCISGNDSSRGSGAVFFSGCPLKCVFCQNKAISRQAVGEIFTPLRLADEMRRLENDGAYNINLVSPTHFVPQIIEALDIYKPQIPVIFNTGGWELPETVAALDGYADIFLTDFKYGTNELAKSYSACAEYVDTALSALKIMVQITKKPHFGSDGMLKSGTVVRHLVLPASRRDSKTALHLVADAVGSDSVLLSLMSQYTPEFAPANIPSLQRRVTTFEYEYVRNAALSLGFEGYSQNVSSAHSTYTPDFLRKG